MSRISRYVLRDMFWPTTLGLLIYGIVMLMNLLLGAAELFIRRDLPLAMVGQYLLLSLPRIIVLATPMAILVGVLVGVARLVSDSEITALRASGYSDRRLMVPVMILGLAATIVSAILFDLAVPASNYAQHQLTARIFLKSDINREVQAGVFYERIPNLLVYAQGSSPEDGSLRNVLLHQKSPGGHEEIYFARSLSMQQQELRGAIEFQLDDVVSHAWTASSPGRYQISHSARQIIDRPPDIFALEMVRSLATPPPPNLREQSFGQLRATLGTLRALPDTPSARRQIDETLVELHKKVSLPATSLVFAILALPLALGHRRQAGRTWGFIVSILVVAISYALLTAGEQMASRGRIPPWFAMWSWNILFGGIGAILMVTGARVDITSWVRLRRPAETTRIGQAIAAEREAELQIPEPRLRQRRFPSTIERYLFRHLIPLSLFVAASLMVLFTIFYAVELVDDLSKGDKSVALLIPYLLYLQPQVLFASVAPISLCIGTLVTFALLARTQELTAIRAGGIGLFRIAAPFIVAGFAVAVASFVAYDRLLPLTNQKANMIRDEIRNRSARSYRRPERRWVFGSQGLLFYFSEFNANRAEFQDLALIRFEPGSFDILEHTFAKRAVAQEGGGWLLIDGWSRRFTPQGEAYEPFTALRRDEIDPPEYFTQDWKAPDQMNFAELRNHILELEQRGHDTRELRVGLHRKVAIPAVSIVMVLIGFPLALRVERKGPMFAIATSIVIVFIYFGVLQVFGKLGEVAALPPFVAGWAPNVIFSGLGLWLTGSARW